MPSAFQRPQHAVEVSHVDPLGGQHLGQVVGQLVSVGRPVLQDQQQSRLNEPFDPGMDSPLAGPCCVCSVTGVLGDVDVACENGICVSHICQQHCY